MAKEDLLLIQDFYGGIVRDEKSRVRGSASNIEELDIMENADFIRPTQILTSDALPASSEIYAFTGDNDDTVWGYGKETVGDKVRIFKVTTGGADNPGAWATQATSSDASNVAYAPSPIQYFRQDETGNDFIYYLTNNSGTIRLARYDITNSTEDTYISDAWVTKGTPTSDSDLEGLDGSFDRCFMKVLFGELLISNGQYIAKVDKDGVFTKKAFTLPNGWEAVDIIAVSDLSLILARNINKNINESRGFWWDLTETVQVDDSFPIPWGGPQWIVNFRERVIMFCALGGKGKFYVLSGAFPGAVPIGFQDIELANLEADAATQPISAPKMIDMRSNVLYFGLNKTDKSGIYGMGQLDSNKPTAVWLAKRFDTSDYSNHSPTALHIQGPNFYAAFDDNGTADNSRCESNNSPARSSNAVYESVWLDIDAPLMNKTADSVFVQTKPLAASTAVAVSVDSDYGGSYTAITRADGTTLNGTGDIQGDFTPTGLAGKKVTKIKLAFTSNNTDTPSLTAVGVKMTQQEMPASE